MDMAERKVVVVTAVQMEEVGRWVEEVGTVVGEVVVAVGMAAEVHEVVRVAENEEENVVEEENEEDEENEEEVVPLVGEVAR